MPANPDSLRTKGSLVTARLGEDLTEFAAAEASERGVSRSVIVREALALYLTLHPDEDRALGLTRAREAAEIMGEREATFWFLMRDTTTASVHDALTGAGPLVPADPESGEAL